MVTRVTWRSNPEDHDGRHGDPDAEGDGLSGRTGGLRDVVLEDRRRPEAEFRQKTKRRDRDDGDRNRRADREPHFEHQIERRRSKHDAEHRAEDERRPRELPQVDLRGNVGAKRQGGRRGCGGCGDWSSSELSRRRPCITRPSLPGHLSIDTCKARSPTRARPTASLTAPASSAVRTLCRASTGCARRRAADERRPPRLARRRNDDRSRVALYMDYYYYSV